MSDSDHHARIRCSGLGCTWAAAGTIITGYRGKKPESKQRHGRGRGGASLSTPDRAVTLELQVELASADRADSDAEPEGYDSDPKPEGYDSDPEPEPGL